MHSHFAPHPWAASGADDDSGLLQDPDAQAAHRLLQAMWNKDYQVGSCDVMLRVSIL